MVSPPFGFCYKATINGSTITGKVPRTRKLSRAAFFFSRAYNQYIPDESESSGQEKLHQNARNTSILTITELLQCCKPELLNDAHAGDWDFHRAIAKVQTQRSLGIEERKWADKIVESCNLVHLKSSRKKQMQQQDHLINLAIRTLDALPASGL